VNPALWILLIVLGLVFALVALGIVAALVAPYGTLRGILTLLGRCLFWHRVEGAGRMPPTGPLLLVHGPINPLAWLHLLWASPRPIRFLVLAGWARQGWSAWLLRQSGALIPAGGSSADIEKVLQQAGDALRQGQVVCLFAASCKTSDGETCTYSRLFDALPRVPTMPVVLLQPRGSMMALHGTTPIRKWTGWFAPAEVTFGPVLPTTDAGHARQAVQLLSAEAAIARKNRSVPVHRQFLRTASVFPFRTCWIDSSAPGQDMTYAKAYVGAACLAELLRSRLGSARMVGIWLPPGRGSALANIALAFLGKVAVNLNYTSSNDGIRSCLRQCECTHVLTARRFTARLSLDPGPSVELIHLEDLLPLVSSFQKTITFLSLLLLPAWVLERFVRRIHTHTPADLLTIIFSSGSTGEPKGVMLSHGNIACNLESIIQAANFAERDRLLGVLPFFHSFGYAVTLWGPLQIGASAVYHADPRQAKEIGELCRKHRATVYLSTATFLRFCLRKCDPTDFQSLRLLICGAEKLPPALALEFAQRFGVLPMEGYGCTELSPVVSANLADQPMAGLTEGFNRIGTVGAPVPGVATRTVDPDTLALLPLGSEGLLLVKGANVMEGYYQQPGLTQRVVREGWYVTGDMARMDSEGHIVITGRLSRFAKIGGEMVPLEKVEEALHEAIGVAERVCAVACVPDESRGERVVVLYLEHTLIEGGHNVRHWLQALDSKGLPNLWIPCERDFHAVPDLPVLGTGKLNLQGVKEMALSLAVARR
jgi:acyl-[acyl-carrier-protein]-phospholipid O-acyltransferase/long-chain-fatty-acid--[acyl-carrier-protein] ligase